LLAYIACGGEDQPPSGGSPSGGTSPAGGAGGTSTQTGGTTGSAGSGAAGSDAGGAAGSGGSAGTGAGGSSGSAGSGTAGTGAGGKPTLPSGRGATVPWIEYEAETMETNGTVLAPSRTFTAVAAEASGRQAVKLSQAGQYVKFTNQSASNSIVVRYSIPDGGSDYWTTLGVYVNDELRKRLSVTSRYSWTYGGGDNDFNHPDQNNPNRGAPHHYFDEARALIGDVPAGAKIMLRKDAADSAAEYVIDLVDMEAAPAALPRPDGFLSVTEDCGATANDQSDDSSALQRCIDRVQGERRAGLYIPPGEFRSLSKPLSVSNITIRGAGIWHSTISGFFARFDCWGNNCKYYDFAVFGDTILRDDASPETAFGGNGSSGTLLENIWIEHTKTGYWTGPNTNGLVIKNSRIRNLFADAVNFYGGTSNSIVENCHARNTGDDAFASWSPGDRAVNRANVFRKNSVQVPWKANCFGIYGGESIVIEDNVCADVVQYPGILLARQFGSHPFTGRTRIERNSLIRAGGNAYDQGHGAFKLHAAEGALQNVAVTDLDIVEPSYSGIHVQGQQVVDSVWFERVNIHTPTTAAFHLTRGAQGAMDAANVVVTGAPSGVLDDSGGRFTILKGAGNSGW
jgi:hypothetical protein